MIEEEKEREMGKEEIFKKSNVTARSPLKRKRKKEERNEKEGRWEEILMSWKEEMEEVMKEMKGIKDWREDIRVMKEEVKEEIKEQGRILREEVERMRREIREKEERWGKEREELRGRIQELERSMEQKEENRIERSGVKLGGKGGDGGVESRINEIERRMEKKEREERRKNVIIRRVEVRKGKRREAVEEIMKIIGVKADIGKVKKIGGEVGKGGKSLWVKLGSHEQRRDVWINKGKLRGRRERILEDWT